MDVDLSHLLEPEDPRFLGSGVDEPHESVHHFGVAAEPLRVGVLQALRGVGVLVRVLDTQILEHLFEELWVWDEDADQERLEGVAVDENLGDFGDRAVDVLNLLRGYVLAL